MNELLNLDTLYQAEIFPYFAGLPDERGRNKSYELADIWGSCFAMFSLKSPSLLAFEERLAQEEVNNRSVYHLRTIPSDSQLRNILDKIADSSWDKLYPCLLHRLEKTGKLNGYYQWGKRLLISIDGTRSFSSKKIHCPCCLTQKDKKGQVTYGHGLLSAVVVCPERQAVFPMAHEPLSKQDGETKNDCELNAVKRLLVKLQTHYSDKKFLFVEDALYANAPHIEQLLAMDAQHIIGVKPESHTCLFSQVKRAAQTGKLKTKVLTNSKKQVQEIYRYVPNLRLNQAHNIRVNRVSYERWENGKRTPLFTWITNRNVSVRNVDKIAQMGRSRWKIENKTFNTLKNQSYKFEHNYGHGKQFLAHNFALLMLLVFLADQIQQACCRHFQQAWKCSKTKVKLWERIRAIIALIPVQNMTQCLLILIQKKQT